MDDLAKTLLDNQKKADERFEQLLTVLAPSQSTKKAEQESALVDILMKIGVALCVAGILYVAATLQSVQLQSKETSTTVNLFKESTQTGFQAVKESITELKFKYEQSAAQQQEAFTSAIQPYDQRLRITEQATKDNRETVEEIRDSLNAIKYSVDRIDKGESK